LLSLARKASKAAVLAAGPVTRRRRGDLTILLYHRVGAGTGEVSLPVRTFRRHLAHLGERQPVVSLDQALANGRRGGVVLTFDDGYRDFTETVAPLLVEHGLPALLYLTTGYVAEEGGLGGEALSWSQLREAVATGLVTVGSHTHTHADLSRATERTSREEMKRSKGLIEDRLGLPCRHFAYPWAVGSPAADRMTRELFDSAAWEAWRTNRRGRIDPHRLGRIPVLRSDGQFFFRAKVNGLLDAEALVYRAVRRGPWGR
jgi:peptidoglycan/xylan/chitin deacetylase (PgdA/CDA1 family)